MKKFSLLTIILFSTRLFAYDFSVDGIFYDIVSSGANPTVSVAQGNYSGNIVLERTVTYREKEYTLVGIGDEAFYGCEEIITVNMPNSVTKIGDKAFEGCKELTSVYLSNALTHIGQRAFYGCEKLSSIKLPASLVSIGSQAFYFSSYYTNTNISTLTINNTVEIGQDVFAGRMLSDIYINVIDFSKENKLADIASKVHYLIDGAEITDLVIPDNVNIIGENLLKNCQTLTSITIPKSVKKICDYAFLNCPNLTNVYVLDLKSWFDVDFNTAQVYTYSLYLYQDGEEVIDIVVPNGISSIKSNAFRNARNIKSIVLNNTITSIGSNAFDSCESLQSVKLPSTLTFIGQKAFYNCGSLTEVNISDTVTAIGSYAFGYCVNLTKVTLSKAIKCIAQGLFLGCQNLASIEIPETVTVIGSNAFQNTALCSVKLPINLSEIGSQAFSYCRNLKEIKIPDAVTNIGMEAFHNCNNLTTVTLSKAIKRIAQGLFSGCHNLVSIEIPEGITDIEEMAFYYCTSLKSLTIPSSVANIGNIAFGMCNSIASVKINSNEVASMTNIARQSPGYYENNVFPSSLTEVIFGEGVHDIGGLYSFEYNNNLNTIVIPSTAKKIGYNAFGYCKNLTQVKYLCKNPVAMESGRQGFNFYATTILIVPNRCAKIINDQGIEPWKSFRSIVELPAADVNIDESVNTADVVAVYNYIINGSDETEEIIFEDVNNDGSVNTADVVAVYNYIINGSNTEQ